MSTETLIPDDVKIIVLDTETTDADAERGVCEVGWVQIDAAFNILETHESLIDPQRKISAAASGIHGLTNSDVASAPTLEEYFSVDDPSCYGKKIQGPVIVVGHRISFDTHTIAPFIDGDVFELCSLRWIRRLYPDMDNHQLSTAMYALDLPRPQGAHRVLSDVLSAMYLVRHLCERMGVSIVELARQSQQPFELDRYPFGKHQGELFSKVPKSYLRWALDNLTDIDQDMAYTLNLHLNKG